MKRRDAILFGAMAAGAQAQTAADAEPQVNDIEKYPKCGYCGMDRKQFHHSRMLVQYGNGAVEGVCSIRCLATSLARFVGRGTKGVWVGDNASAAETKPLCDAERAHYLVGSSLRGVMTRRSKVAYSTVEAAEASMKANGGTVMDFDQTLMAAYEDIVEMVKMRRKMRAEAK